MNKDWGLERLTNGEVVVYCYLQGDCPAYYNVGNDAAFKIVSSVQQALTWGHEHDKQWHKELYYNSPC